MQPENRSRLISAGTAAVFGIALTALLVIALFPVFPRRLNIRVDDTAARTVKSPRTVSFDSTFLTDQRRDDAGNAVPPVLVYDPAIRTNEVSAYDRAAAQVTQARALTDDARKRDALAQLQISPRSIDTAIGLDEDRWQAVAADGRRVLTQELNVSLDEAAVTASKDGVDSRISVDFTADEALLTADLVRPLITSTLIADQAQTDRVRQDVRANVPDQRVNVAKGDIILAADQRVDEVAIEKLRAVGLLSRSVEWRNVVAVIIVASVAAMALAALLLVLQPRGITTERQMIALALVTMLPLLVAKFYLPLVMPDDSRHFLAFILPVAAAPILIAALLDTQLSVVVAVMIGILIAFISALLPDVSLVASVSPIDTFRLLAVYGLAPLAGVLLVHRADRLNRYLSAGIAVAVVSFALLLATWFIDGDRQVADLAWIALATGVGGIGSGVLAAGAFVTVGVLFGVTTRVQLMELSQLNAPLLRRLQDEAPG
ncbi:MAG TPA: hypothetical protein VIH21_11525, partial [Dehalococcoidia bacterium]